MNECLRTVLSTYMYTTTMAVGTFMFILHEYQILHFQLQNIVNHTLRKTLSKIYNRAINK